MFRWLAVWFVVGSFAWSAKAQDPCSALTEAQVRTLTGVASGGFSRRSSRVAAGDSLCDYGVYQGDLVLEIYRFASESQASDKMARLGEVTNSDNDTDSPYGTDQVNAWSAMIDDPTGGIFDLRGFAVRHGATVVTIGLNRPESDFSPAGNKRLQGAALVVAGAHLVPWPTENICTRVPPAAVQTLVSLGATQLVSTDHTSTGGNSSCTYIFQPLDQSSTATVNLKAERWINDLEALAREGKKGIALPFTTADPRDVAATPVSPDLQATALHAGELGRVSVNSPEDAAADDPSYRTHLAQAALLAAGGTITGGAGLAAIPKPVAPTPLSSLVATARRYSFAGLIVLVIALFLWWRHTRKQRIRTILTTGIPGRAVVNSISDTGITINNSPRIRLHLTVTPDGGAPFAATMGMNVSRLEAPASWVGRVVEVRIDRNNPTRFLMVPAGR